MDNTGNGQAPQQIPPTQPISETQAVPPQPPISAQNSAMQPPTVPPEPIVQAQPGVAAVSQNPPAPKLTLDDLYGPSGFAKVEPTSPAPIAPMQTPLQAQPPTLPVQPVPQEQPIQSEPVLPQPAQVLPTAGESKPVGIPEAVVTQPSLNDLPLRKSQFISGEKETTTPEVMPATPPSSPKKPENNKTKKGMNTFFFLRFLFGSLGILLLVGIFYFVVTFLSAHIKPISSGKVTLTYWGLWEDSNTMQVAITAFEQQHPDITVQYEKEDPKEYSQRLLAHIKDGNGPDIFTYHSSWLPMIQPILAPLPTSVINKNDLQNNFYPVVRTDLVKNGALYGIPLEVDTLALFVNTSLFESAKAQVPTTWDGFAATARALTQKDENGKIKIAGAAMGTYGNITHAPDILSALFVQNGVNIATLSPQNNASDALTFYTSFATGDSNVWDNTLDPSQLAFAKGNLAMYFGYSWDIFALKAINPNLNFAIYPIPHLPGRNTTIASYWVQGVSSKSTHQKEALEFMQFLAQKDTEAMLYAEEAKTRLFGEPYARSDLGATVKNNPLVYPFISQATDATSSFFAGETQDTGLNGPMNQYIGNAINSVLPPNNTSFDSAISTLLQGVQQVESQYASQ